VVKKGQIEVTGEGRVSVAPDVADLRLGVSLSRDSVAELRDEAARLMTAIIDAVAATGVEKRDLRTSLLSVQPRYAYHENEPPRPAGYEMANVVEVTVRDLARLTEVIDAALGAGATSMDGLSFRLDDPSPAEREARTRAMANARARADVLAEAAGLSISGVASVVEGGGFGPPRPFAAKAERMMMAADVATPVETGSMDVSVTVAVTYRTGRASRAT
jgi:uncharacterized protein